MTPNDIMQWSLLAVCLVFIWLHERRLGKQWQRMNTLERLVGFKLVMAALGCKEKKGAKK